eukprot:GSChrysophyteH1.ASY1.ANO1.2182.1 assembled CDS
MFRSKRFIQVLQHRNPSKYKNVKSRLLSCSPSPSGQEGTDSYRVHFEKDGKRISPWHDIALNAEGGLYNYICEIPKYTTAKMEIALKEPHNPIAQDIGKKGELRHYHGPIFWNYGCLPQTWEDPDVEHPILSCKGDSDPLDVVEIGTEPLPTGTINAADPIAAEVNSIEDVDALLPGYTSGIREWFRWYKTPGGTPVNAFGFGEKWLHKDEALQVVHETHEQYLRLRDGKTLANGLFLE